MLPAAYDFAMSNPQNFCHPYEPYDIQKQLMNAVYDCLDNGKVGIFESPTGVFESASPPNVFSQDVSPSAHMLQKLKC